MPECFSSSPSQCFRPSILLSGSLFVPRPKRLIALNLAPIFDQSMKKKKINKKKRRAFAQRLLSVRARPLTQVFRIELLSETDPTCSSSIYSLNVYIAQLLCPLTGWMRQLLPTFPGNGQQWLDTMAADGRRSIVFPQNKKIK